MTAHAVSLEFDRRPSALPYMARSMMPVSRHSDLAPRITARWRGHRAQPEDLAEFERIAGRHAPPGVLPLLYPHTFGFRLAMAILTHPRFPVPIWGVLQVRNHLEQRVPMAADSTLDFETRVMQGRPVAKGAEFDLRTTVHVAGALTWQSDVTFFTRGWFGAGESTGVPARAPMEFGPQVAQWLMSDTDHVRFGRFTGDYNGIHLWDWYAKRFGFRRALYHPPRVLGQCLTHLRTSGLIAVDADRQRLDAWLKGPVLHGAQVRLHAALTAGDVASRSTTFALFMDEDRPCIVGRWSDTRPSPALRATSPDAGEVPDMPVADT